MISIRGFRDVALVKSSYGCDLVCYGRDDYGKSNIADGKCCGQSLYFSKDGLDKVCFVLII